MPFRTCDLSRRAHASSSSSSSSSTTIDDYTPRNSSSSDRTVSSTPSRRDSISSTISNISYLLPWIDTHSRPDLPDLGLRRRAHLRRQSAESDDSGRPRKDKYIRPLPPIPAEAWQYIPPVETTRPISENRPLRRLPIPPLRPSLKAAPRYSDITLESSKPYIQTDYAEDDGSIDWHMVDEIVRTMGSIDGFSMDSH